MQQLKEEMEEKPVGIQQTTKVPAMANNLVGFTHSPTMPSFDWIQTEEEVRELAAWTQRRMNDQQPVKRQVADWPEEAGRHFEGDIVLTGEQAKQILDGLQRSKRMMGRPRVKRKFIGSRVGAKG